MGIDFARSAERAIPAVEAPSLAELGLGAEVRATTVTRTVHAARPFATAAVMAGSWALGWWPVTLLLVPLLYGWSLSAVHHLIHGSLGFGARTRQVLLSATSMLLLESGHALERTHLAHHGVDPDAEDPEGYIESLPLPALLLEAPMFRYRLWGWARRQPGSSARATVEQVWHAALTGAALLVAMSAVLVVEVGWWALFLVVHVGTQHLANAVFAVLAARGPHTNWGRPTPTPLIAVRGRIAGVLLFGHTWHLEHHLYPEVPLARLSIVAAELDDLLAANDALTVRVP